MRSWAFGSKVSSAKCFHATVVSTICVFIACCGANTWSFSLLVLYTQTSVRCLGLKTLLFCSYSGETSRGLTGTLVGHGAHPHSYRGRWQGGEKKIGRDIQELVTLLLASAEQFQCITELL